MIRNLQIITGWATSVTGRGEKGERRATGSIRWAFRSSERRTQSSRWDHLKVTVHARGRVWLARRGPASPDGKGDRGLQESHSASGEVTVREHTGGAWSLYPPVCDSSGPCAELMTVSTYNFPRQGWLSGKSLMPRILEFIEKHFIEKHLQIGMSIKFPISGLFCL